MSGTCPYYSTAGDTTVECGPVSVCPGTSITISGCGACTGYQQLSISNSSGVVQTRNYGGCGSTSTCAKFTYGVSANSTSCEDYTIDEICYGGTPCTGTVSYTRFENPVPYVNVYSVYETNGCGGTPYVSTDAPVGSCILVDAFYGTYMQVTCDGSSSASSWTAVTYPNGNCFGSFNEKVHGADSSSCESFVATRMRDYKISVNCATTFPSNNDDGNKITSDPAFIGGIAAGGAVVVLLAIAAVVYFRGGFKCTKTPMASTAEPLV